MRLNPGVSGISFIVPGPPVAKGRARSFVLNGHVRHHTPEKTVRYESTVALMASAAMRGRPLIDGPMRVTLHVAMQIPASWSNRKTQQARDGTIRPTGRPDLDNVAKAICDACNGVVWRDDSAVVELVVGKRYADAPQVAVTVEKIGAV